MNPKVTTYLLEGCGRCDYYRTPQCKVHTWVHVLEELRKILLKCDLKEEYKWSQPCYTYKGKNILIATAFKDYAALAFFKGALLKDKANLLVTPGKNSQAGRQLRFATTQQVKKMEAIIKAYILEAIEVEKAGLEITYKKQPEPMPIELLEKMNNDAVFKTAFESLTPGRQRGYVIYFSQPKQSGTRIARIEKYAQQILQGKGIHDDYKMKK